MTAPMFVAEEAELLDAGESGEIMGWCHHCGLVQTIINARRGVPFWAGGGSPLLLCARPGCEEPWGVGVNKIVAQSAVDAETWARLESLRGTTQERPPKL